MRSARHLARRVQRAVRACQPVRAACQEFLPPRYAVVNLAVTAFVDAGLHTVGASRRALGRTAVPACAEGEKGRAGLRRATTTARCSAASAGASHRSVNWIAPAHFRSGAEISCRCGGQKNAGASDESRGRRYDPHGIHGLPPFDTGRSNHNQNRQATARATRRHQACSDAAGLIFLAIVVAWWRRSWRGRDRRSPLPPARPSGRHRLKRQFPEVLVHSRRTGVDVLHDDASQLSTCDLLWRADFAPPVENAFN